MLRSVLRLTAAVSACGISVFDDVFPAGLLLRCDENHGRPALNRAKAIVLN